MDGGGFEEKKTTTPTSARHKCVMLEAMTFSSHLSFFSNHVLLLWFASCVHIKKKKKVVKDGKAGNDLSNRIN